MKLTDAEWTVMQVVWQRQPATVRQVWEVVDASTGWAYTTVKTILDRLVEKGALDVHKRGKASVFEARVSRDQARRSALRNLIDKAFDGTIGSLVAHLVADEPLSVQDRRELKSMLEDLPPRTQEEARDD